MKTFLLIALFLSAALAQAQQPGWTNYTYAGNVNAMANDGDYIWAATEGGLVRLNTISGEREFFNKANSGLPSNYIISVAVDKQGIKWIATGLGIVRYDGANWQRISMQQSPMALDSSGGLWYCITDTVNGNIRTQVMHYKDGIVTNYSDTLVAAVPVTGPYYGLNWIGAITVDRRGTVWFSIDNKGHLAYNKDRDTCSYHPNAPEYSRTRIYFDKNNDLWTIHWPGSTAYDSSGIIEYKGGEKFWNSNNAGVALDYVSAIQEDSTGAIYFLTEHSIAKYFNGTWSPVQMPDIRLPFSSMLIGKNNTIWLGANNSIIRLENGSSSVYGASNSGLCSKIITTIAFQPNAGRTKTWIGTYNGLATYDGQNWKSYLYDETTQIGLQVKTIVFDSSGGIWLLASDSRLLRFNVQDEV